MRHSKKVKTRINWPWALLVASLAAVALVGVILASTRYDRSATIEISLDQREPVQGTIYVGEEVAVPGIYPFNSDDTIRDILAAAGGPAEGADLSHLSLTGSAQSKARQRVDINSADQWLLEALPGIGEILAQRIIDYRQQNGPFENTIDITKVSGLGKDTYDKIKELITVNGY